MQVIEIKGDLSEQVISQLREALQCRQEVELRINSIGGSKELAMEIISCLEEFAAAGIATLGIVTGQASSAAFMILQRCAVRKAYPPAKLMFHPLQVHAPPGVYFMGGETTSDSFEPYYIEFLDHLSARCGVNMVILWSWGSEEREYCAQEALILGFIDEIIQ